MSSRYEKIGQMGFSFTQQLAPDVADLFKQINQFHQCFKCFDSKLEYPYALLSAMQLKELLQQNAILLPNNTLSVILAQTLGPIA